MVDLTNRNRYPCLESKPQSSPEVAMKYIMFEDFSGTAVPVIFPNRINHEEMREQMPYTKVLSAGHVILKEGVFSCYGSSKALKAEIAADDAKVIAAKFGDAES
jgi:hypothetical protein